MALMAVNLKSDSHSIVLRFLRWVLSRNQGEVKAMEDALRLQRLFRFIMLLAAMILMPSVLLAYFGISSIKGEEMAEMGEVARLAEGAGEAFWAQYERPFTSFEQAVRTRLEAGRSPLESPTELHPYVVVALKLDSDLQIQAPFVRLGASSSEAARILFDEDAIAAAAAERRSLPPSTVAQMYGKASRKARGRQGRARLRFDQARMLLAAGRVVEAETLLDTIENRFGNVRDPWGFRMSDLVRLQRGERRLSTDRQNGAALLRSLVDDLMTSRWAISQGGEAAVARRALSRIEPLSDKEWVAASRSRIDARTAQLYWTSQLLPELDQVLAGYRFLRVDRGKVRWHIGERGLWGTTWWGEHLYVFGLDTERVIADLGRAAASVVKGGSPINCTIVKPGDEDPLDTLVRRSLKPWLSGWSMVVRPRDPQTLATDMKSRRMRRVGIVVLAVVMIGVGALGTARLVSNELDNARMKADFAANVSHELRSPITQIRLKAESLMFGLSDTPEEQQRDYRIIVRESERLSRLVDNVLDFSAIERGAKRYHLMPGLLDEPVEQALDSVLGSAELEDRRVVVDLSGDLPMVDFDADAVAQCVINLLSNAAKYSEAGTPIHIRTRRRRGGAEVAVVDKGIGIPPTDVRQIFDPFYRGADAQVRRRKGTGIGLAITFYIMQAHGGRVDVVSTPGEGSTFSLWFPATSPVGLSDLT